MGGRRQRSRIFLHCFIGYGGTSYWSVYSLGVDQASVRLVGLHGIGAFLRALHEVEDGLAIHAPLGVAVGCHISGVTPLNLLDDPVLELFPNPHGVAQ